MMNETDEGIERIERAVIEAIEEIYLKGNKSKKFAVKRNASLVADMGFDSFEVLNLIAKIEARLGVRIPDERLVADSFQSVNSVIATVRQSAVEGNR